MNMCRFFYMISLQIDFFNVFPTSLVTDKCVCMHTHLQRMCFKAASCTHVQATCVPWQRKTVGSILIDPKFDAATWDNTAELDAF